MAGANSSPDDLFDFGDEEGQGFDAKLQHPLGVHYCEANLTLYVADTYNHKIKVMVAVDVERKLTKQTYLGDWIGSSTDKNPRVLNGTRRQARLNEPNGCWARTRTTPHSSTVLGLYIADTGNDCIRYARGDGHVETLELIGVPDVRSTAGCSGDVCGMPSAATANEEEKKEE